MKYFKLIILFFTAVIFLSGCSWSFNTYHPQAKEGVLDLTDYDLVKNDTLKLDGEWEFYWNSLLSYKELLKAKPSIFAGVPSTWNEYLVNGKSLPGQGYATYRLHIKTVLSQDTMLGLRIYSFSSAYKLFINDKLIAVNGNPGKTSAEETGKYRPQAVIFNAPAGDFDIIIHVSNFEYARGGFWYSMEIGSQDKIQTHHDQIMVKETFLLGTLVILALFFLAGYFMKRELKYFLYFACVCISLAVGLDMAGQFILFRFFPPVSFKMIIFIWYSSTTWIPFFLLLFLKELYKSRFSVIFVKVYLVVTLLQQLLFIFTPPNFYTRFGRISNIVDIVAVACIIATVAIGIRKGMKDGWLNIAGMMIVLITYIHDDLYWTNVINSSYGEIMYIGIFMCIFIQIIIQAKRLKGFYDSKTAAELSFLQAQIKPHFLYNSINTFISISRYDMDHARNLLISFSNYLRRSFDFKDLSQFVPLKNEVELVKAFVEIQKARFEEEFEVNFDICDDMEIKVPILILQPIVENAIMHGVLPGQLGGKIDISIKKEEKSINFSVKDNGVGIPDVSIFETGSREYGHGVGLSNINRRLKELYGKGLDIKSIPGKGTEVNWLIPIKKKRKSDA